MKPSKIQLTKHLNTLSNDKLGNDYAYITSSDLDRSLWWANDKKYRKIITERLVAEILIDRNAKNLDTYLNEIGYKQKSINQKSIKMEYSTIKRTTKTKDGFTSYIVTVLNNRLEGVKNFTSKIDFLTAKKRADKFIKSIKNQSGMKAAAKKPAKKATKKVEGINSRTGKLMKGYKYQNGKVVKVKTATQKAKQTGATHVKEDKMHKALKPGKRVSKTGKGYYERRANRSDVGKLLGSQKGLGVAVCVRRNRDGSTTTYSAQNGTDCSYGGVIKETMSLAGAKKKKPATAKQLEARKRFVANVRAGKYKK